MELSPGNVTFKHKLGLRSLVSVIFLTVCAGAYGIEDLISASGPGIALLLIVLTPLIWSLPSTLILAELSSAMPVEGGYYAWVKRAFGQPWAFLEGWWRWLYSFVDIAIYPVFFTQYLSTLLSQWYGITALDFESQVHLFGLVFAIRPYGWALSVIVIWVFVWVNVRGIRLVGMTSDLFTLFILVPFAVMSVFGIVKLLAHPVPIWEPFSPPGESLINSFGVGLFVVLWNYMGWDHVSTVMGELENPRRNFPRALAIALPLITLAYLLPVVAGLAVERNWTQWESGYFPVIASAAGGTILGIVIAIGGLISAMGLFNANLLGISRLPFVMAEDGFLPQTIKRIHPRHGTPWISIISCGFIYSLFCLLDFPALVVADVILYSAGLILQFAALVWLRIRAPGMERPYRIPGGWAGVAIACLFPTAIILLAVVGTVYEEGVNALFLSIVALVSGPMLYPFFRRWFKRGAPDASSAADPTREVTSASG